MCNNCAVNYRFVPKEENKKREKLESVGYCCKAGSWKGRVYSKVIQFISVRNDRC